MVTSRLNSAGVASRAGSNCLCQKGGCYPDDSEIVNVVRAGRPSDARVMPIYYCLAQGALPFILVKCHNIITRNPEGLKLCRSAYHVGSIPDCQNWLPTRPL